MVSLLQQNDLTLPLGNLIFELREDGDRKLKLWRSDIRQAPLSFGSRVSRPAATVRCQKNRNGRSNKLNISRQHRERCQALNIL
ncbi:hypothetical protein [Microcoleus sp. LEGE 07076]|uniref:hypothetical protein n=1 Tax=Microcoleus sp. LEGE 07076 TaxID=915322 RepID=UPI00187E1AA1|nr:hypothetical protein [Microcoleus sp. LEGE 07076]